MTKKYIAITLAMVMGASLLMGCGNTTGSSSEVGTEVVQQESVVEDVIFGQVSDLTDDSITVKVVDRPQMGGGPQGGQSQSGDSDNSEVDGAAGQDSNNDAGSSDNAQVAGQDDKNNAGGSENAGASGEEKTIKIVSGTTFEKTSMGQPPAMPNGQMPSGAPNGSSDDQSSDGNNQPPAMPGSQSSDGQSSDGKNQPPAMPGSQSSDGQSSDGNNQPPAMPNGQPPQMETEEISASDIQVGDTVSITLDNDGNAAKITLMSMGQGGPNGAGGPNGQSVPGGNSQSAPESYEAVNSYSKDTEVGDETISSTGTDESAVYVSDGAKVTISDCKISRSSSDSTGGDQSSFYGTGAAVLTTDGTTYIKDSQIETDANGGAGVFSYGDGKSYVSNVSISTKEGTSGGLHVAGGGTLYAWDSDVETNGASSAAIRSDRGGGTMVVDGGSYTSNGTGSPAIYSTADIAVNNARLTATASEAICIEGNNSIHLFNSDLSGNMSDNSQNDTTWNVILYQSMSGDSEEGNSTFEMNGGSLTANNGGMFYTTNTESTITLKNVDITNADDAEYFLRCTGNQNQRGWGTSGANGADCLFTAIQQKMEGDIQWDTISELDFYLTDGSSLKGAVINDESCAGKGGEGYCNLTIDKDSTWTVTGDSTLTTLSSSGKIIDENGKTVTIKGSDGTVYVKGDSNYTVTVKEYKDSADTDNASSLTSWSDYQVDKPE